jgi:hypothetical protein
MLAPRCTSSLVVALVVLVGCRGDDILHRLVRPEDDAFARAYFDSVRTGRIDFAVQALSPTTAGISGVRDNLVRLSKYLPNGPLDSLHVIAVNRFSTPSVDRTTMAYEYHSSMGWGVVSITSASELGRRYVDGIHADRLDRSLEVANAFTLRGKGGGHYLMLALMLVCVGTAISVALLALRTPMRRRWLWALFALVGAGTLVFNWTTGQVGFSLLNLQFFNGGAVRGGPAAPWILSAAFPVGALLTWRRIQLARETVIQTETTPAVAPAQGDV